MAGTQQLKTKTTTTCKAGVYTVWVECNANSMKDQYKSPDGSDYTGKTISAVKSVKIATDQVKIEATRIQLFAAIHFQSQSQASLMQIT